MQLRGSAQVRRGLERGIIGAYCGGKSGSSALQTFTETIRLQGRNFADRTVQLTSDVVAMPLLAAAACNIIIGCPDTTRNAQAVPIDLS